MQGKIAGLCAKVSRRKSGKKQGETRRGYGKSRVPRVYQPPRSWKTHKEKPLKDTYAIGKVAKLKMVQLEPGIWRVIHIYFIVDEKDEYLEKDELTGKTLRVVEKDG